MYGVSCGRDDGFRVAAKREVRQRQGTFLMIKIKEKKNRDD